MHYRSMAFGPTVPHAPENDDGFEVDDELDQDDELDEDDPDEDEDPDEDDEDQGEDDQGDEPSQRQVRERTRNAKLSKERNEFRERTGRLERELNDLKARPAPQTVQPQESQEQFQARLASMDPVERVAYLQDLQARSTNQQLQNMQFMLGDQTDKLGFDAYSSGNPVAKKLTQQVEDRLKDYRKQGINIPRMDVLKHLLGERALNNEGRSRNKAERGAAARREREASRPAGGRSDAAGREPRGAQDTPEAREKRLLGRQI